MAYAQQAAWFCSLILLLQASICARKRCRPTPTPISAATIYKKLRYKPLPLDHALEESEQQAVDFNPEFDDDDKTFNPEFGGDGYKEVHPDAKDDGHAGYDSGYDSDQSMDKDANAIPKLKQPPSSVSDLKKRRPSAKF